MRVFYKLGLILKKLPCYFGIHKWRTENLDPNIDVCMRCGKEERE